MQHALEPVGERRQKSVFECRLTITELDSVWRQVARLIDPATDSVLAWPLHAADLPLCRGLGLATPPDDEDPLEVV